jgi:hypothetical protein
VWHEKEKTKQKKKPQKKQKKRKPRSLLKAVSAKHNYV